MAAITLWVEIMVEPHATYNREHAITGLRKPVKEDIDRLRAVQSLHGHRRPCEEKDASTFATFKRMQWIAFTVPHDGLK